jgi:regulator of sirC expression with transglutaminase-like and TPR domain
MTERSNAETAFVAAARATLSAAAAGPDSEIDLAEAALALASFDRPNVAPERYREHLALLARDVADRFAEAGTADTIEGRCVSINEILYVQEAYRGDDATYDDIQNANLMRVIDRRRGLPVALGILYLHAGRAQGWQVDGIAFPGHFLIRVDREGERAIVDPFNRGRTCDAAELRRLIKAAAGNEAELAPEFFEPVGNIDILLRLQNNLKIRHIRMGELAKAADAVDRMLLVAPARAELWRDAAMIHVRLDNLIRAIEALERHIALEPRDSLRHQSARLLQELRAKLN